MNIHDWEYAIRRATASIPRSFFETPMTMTESSLYALEGCIEAELSHLINIGAIRERPKFTLVGDPDTRSAVIYPLEVTASGKVVIKEGITYGKD
jgi:hypothetical protein